MSRWIAATPLGAVGRWSTQSQEHARRNAMAACTILAARRLERLEVEEFVAQHLAQHLARRAATELVAAPMRGVG